MAIKDWSTIAGSNSTVGNINWAEGQAPSTVNNSSREMMAELATYLQTIARNAQDYGCTADGATDDRSAIASMDDSSVLLWFGPGTYLVNSDLTIDGNSYISPGAKLKPASGITITINGYIDAGRYQIFDLSVGGTVSDLASNPEVFPEWWGVTFDGITDDTTAWQNLFDCPGATITVGARRIVCGTGRSYITSTITMPNPQDGPSPTLELCGASASSHGLSEGTYGTVIMSDQAIDLLTIGNSSNTNWTGPIIRNITFFDNNAAGDQVTAGIHVKRINHGQIINCLFQNIKNGIGITQSTVSGNPQYWTVRDCRFHRVKKGVSHTSGGTGADWTYLNNTYWGVNVGEALISGSIGLDLSDGGGKVIGGHYQYCEKAIVLTRSDISKLIGVTIENDPTEPSAEAAVSLIDCFGVSIDAEMINGFAEWLNIDSNCERISVLHLENQNSGNPITDNGTDTLFLGTNFRHHTKLPTPIVIGDGLEVSLTNDVFRLTSSYQVVASQTGVTDNLVRIYEAVGSSLIEGQIMYIKAKTGHTITVLHDNTANPGALYFDDSANRTLSGEQIMHLVYNGTHWVIPGDL